MIGAWRQQCALTEGLGEGVDWQWDVNRAMTTTLASQAHLVSPRSWSTSWRGVMTTMTAMTAMTT